MALLSHATIGETTLAVYNLHLESRNGDELRRTQLAEVLNDSCQHSLEVPVIVAGDFNFDLTESRNATLIEKMQFDNLFANLGAHTAKSRWPNHRNALDWILARGPLRPLCAKVHGSVLTSDHYPLSLTLELAPAL